MIPETIAMKNAKPEVQAIADRVSARTNDEEGVAAEIEALLALRRAE